jgi:uncharacterized protein (DUF2236 family)
MRVRVPTPFELVDFFGRATARGDRSLPITDTSPDPGLFGPGTVTWTVMKEPVLILGGGRALLMQAAHPLIAQGAIDHSTYATDPFGRLDRTLVWVVSVTFGTRREARAASREVNRLHAAVTGTLPAAEATDKVPALTAYTAKHPDLLIWVHATFVDTMLATHDAFVGTLSEAERDTFVREWHAVARLMGVPSRGLWRDAGELHDYIRDQVECGPVRPGPGSRRVAQTVVHPPLPTRALRPAWEAVAFATVGLLPAAVRRGYGITWTPAHEAAHGALSMSLRAARAVLPERVRSSPVHDFAQARVAGQLRLAQTRQARAATRSRRRPKAA